MQEDEQTLEESPALRERREKLRAYADQLLEATISLPMPTTHLDAERAAKSVIATDRMLVVVFSKPVRPRVPMPSRDSSDTYRKPKPKLVYDFDDIEDDIYAHDETPPQNEPDLENEPDQNEYAQKEQAANRIFEAYLRLNAQTTHKAEIKSFQPNSNKQFTHNASDP